MGDFWDIVFGELVLELFIKLWDFIKRFFRIRVLLFELGVWILDFSLGTDLVIFLGDGLIIELLFLVRGELFIFCLLWMVDEDWVLFICL